MSTTFDDGAPQMRRFSRDWLGHYWIQLLVGFDIVSAPLLWLHHSWFSVVVNCVVVVPATLLLLHGMAHEVKLCEPCAAKTPLDGHGAAVKRARTLRTVHWTAAPVGGRRFSVPRGLLLYVALLASGFVLPSGPWWGVGDSAVIDGVFYGWIVAWRVHQRLQPWCRQCHWGDGGEEEFVPEPDPSRGLVPSGNA